MTHVLGQCCVNNTKNDCRTLLEWHKSDKIGYRENTENSGNTREKRPFLTFKISKLGHREVHKIQNLDICEQLEIMYTYIPDSGFHIYSFFENSRKNI